RLPHGRHQVAHELLPLRGGTVAEGEEDGLLDLRRVAPHTLAVARDHLDQRPHLVGARARVPHVGVLGDDAEEHLLPRAADHDGRVRLLHRLGEADGVGHRVVPAVERGARLGQHATDDLEGLLEGLQPAGDGLEVDAEVTVLALEPSGAEAQVEAAPAHVVQGRRHLGGDARMAVGVAAHHGADARPPGGLRERGDRRPALEARPLGVDEDRVEVVEVPERVVAPGVGLLPQREELRPLEALLPGLDAEADRMAGHLASYTDSTRGGKRWSMRCVRRPRLLGGLTFLGYPDFGTFEIWTEHWGEKPPLRSKLTRVTAVPYAGAFRPGAPYKGEEILRDLSALLRDFRPTKIFVSHPADHNPDHRALYLFTRVALWDLEGELAAALFPYLVHYKGWPVPRGLGAAEALVPPPLAPPAAWTSLAVPPPARARKRAAPQAHATQYRYDADYLLSFVRANELFGDFPALAPGAPPEPAGTVRSDPPEELTPAERAAFVGVEW